MKRMRYAAVAVMAAASMGAAAAPASARPVCYPDGICVDCSDERLQVIWRKVFGNDAECR